MTLRDRGGVLRTHPRRGARACRHSDVGPKPHGRVRALEGLLRQAEDLDHPRLRRQGRQRAYLLYDTELRGQMVENFSSGKGQSYSKEKTDFLARAGEAAGR